MGQFSNCPREFRTGEWQSVGRLQAGGATSGNIEVRQCPRLSVSGAITPSCCGDRDPGEITLARSFLWGKSFGFKVAMNAARACSAHAQNGLSSGSGDASLVTRTSTNSASSLRRLITSPTRLRRTPSVVRISFYSETMSSLTSQVKVTCSIQSRRNDALGFSTTRQDLNPAMPATSTEVSITPLGRFSRRANGNLRQSLLRSPVAANCRHDLGLRDSG